MGRLTIVLLLIFSLNTWAKRKRKPAKRYEIGGVILKPTGLSAAYRLNRYRFVQGILVISNDLEIHGSYLLGQRRPVRVGGIKLPWYYTVGAFYRRSNVASFGPKAALGVRYRPPKTLVAVFGELGSTIDLTGTSNIDILAAVGCRYRF